MSVAAGTKVAGSGDVTVRVDLGTSGLKVVAVDVAGLVVGRARASYPTARPALGAAEQDTGDWLSATVTYLQELGSQIPPDRWRALGLAVMLPTLVALDFAIRVGGAAGVGRPFAQDLADAAERAVLISPGEPDHSAVGAAMFAAQAIGIEQQITVPDTVLLHPDSSRKSQWEKLFQDHEVARVAQRTTRQESR